MSRRHQSRNGTNKNLEMNKPKADVSDLWIQHQRRNTKTTKSWSCIYCPERKICLSETDLWNHAEKEHQDKIPSDQDELDRFRKSYESNSALKRPTKDGPQSRKPSNNEAVATQANTLSPHLQSKRPLNSPQPTRSLSGLQALNLGSNEDNTVEDEETTTDQPRKRAAVGDGISAGSASPFRENSARPTSGPISAEDTETRRQATKGQLWTPDQNSPFTRSSFDPSNIASIQASRSRAQAYRPANRRTAKPSTPQSTSRSAPQTNHHQQQQHHNHAQNNTPSAILPNRTVSEIDSRSQSEEYNIILQPETRPISQEQLVAEVKGIYAGLVMVEAKCIEVDNKQATLVQGDPPTQPRLNNEQWQALIAPALRRLASKYAMPARMWRHGIHSFLELLRHRLPASLDHMLAFIYLAYSMMALLYETVPAFEDTWIECLGDLGRYRMAIEDDDIRDREVWTGVARHWYSKASDKAPTTGRLYHHLAILARPNALQQLYYYAKSLCVIVPFTSARESILTLFDPVLHAENGHGQYRLPPLDTAFIRAHGHLFTKRAIERFEPAVQEFLALLDSQIGRVTKKFMEQGCHIAISNNVAMLGFASKENPLMVAIAPSPAKEADVDMDESWDESSPSMIAFRHAQNLTYSTLEIVLQRIGDPNVLPFIHVSLVFLFRMSQFSGAMDLLAPAFPWQSLAIMLNTLLKSYKSLSRIEGDNFPLPEKDDVRPFPEDYGMRGLLWSEKYFPEKWFLNEKTDEEEKYHELASMLEQRKERILWLACRIADAGPWITFDSSKPEFSVPGSDAELEFSKFRSMTFASATTNASLPRTETWSTIETNLDAEEDMSSATMTAADTSSKD
ncbi:telomerase-binding protein EST1A protein [Botrytis cinerea]